MTELAILSFNNMEDKILKLTKMWYQYVGMGHHKDRDCHWYINKVWSYGDVPHYKIEHYGYIFKPCNSRRYSSYAGAEKALYRLINKAFQKEMSWAKDVMEDASAYDQTQIDKALWLIKNYKEMPQMHGKTQTKRRQSDKI